MGSSATESFVHQLSPVDHLSPRIHVPKLLYFASEEDPETIITTLRESLSKSIDAFPILGGSVGLIEGSLQMGTLGVQAPFFTANEILSVKDLSNKYDYETIRAKSFPPDAVDGELVAPDLLGNPSRVFLAQANIIRGGLILVCAVHHCVADETGIFNVMKLWSTYCHGGDGAKLVKPEWTDRTALMKGKGTGRLQDHLEYTLLPEEKSATLLKGNKEYISSSSGKTGSAVLFFPDEALERLKKAATKQSENGQNDCWISTNDALCALVWSRVTCARHRIGTDATYSMFNMTVNGRDRLDPPMSPEYTGNVVFVSKAAQPLETLISAQSKLTDIAQVIRKSVLEIDNEIIQDKIKAVTSVNDIGRLAPGGYSSYQRNVGCSSWSKQPYYTLDWGKALGGKCKRLRWRSNISDGIFVIFPRLPSNDNSSFGDGGLEIYIGLQHEPLEYLRQDSFFNQYAQWRCY